ncbi:hypothetical protein HYP18_gp35 [Xuanwuvirus P884B11]|uniref:Uncharacterized protein n=1 Tax=Xuanwuvirus P884B11 TaxID=2844224 RepID=A0A653FSN5_9CAUD|nr:hypothetical protein HYP18_gp35 [Xuanwuvirus P884B11]VUD40196.1 hypothetical protein [Xuanwuvirus P884B11]
MKLWVFHHTLTLLYLSICITLNQLINWHLSTTKNLIKSKCFVTNFSL